MLDFVVIILLLAAVGIGMLIAGLAIGILLVKSRAPGAWKWVKHSFNKAKGTMTLTVYTDGLAVFVEMFKTKAGSILLNPGKNDILVDMSLVDQQQMTNLEGVDRVMIRSIKSAMPKTFDGLVPLSQIVKFVRGRKEKYPELNSLRDFEITCGLDRSDRDPQMERELLAYYTQVEAEYMDEKGEKHIRDVKEVERLSQEHVNKFMKEFAELRRELIVEGVDIVKALDACEERIAGYVIKSIMIELETYYRAMFANKENEFWKGVLFGAAGLLALTIGLGIFNIHI